MAGDLSKRRKLSPENTLGGMMVDSRYLKSSMRQRSYSSIRFQRWLLLLFMVALVAGCARHYTSEVVADPYGLFSGMWHGFISPYSVFINLVSWLLSIFGISFLSGVEIIGRPNTGFFFYYIGFILGLGIYGAGGSR